MTTRRIEEDHWEFINLRNVFTMMETKTVHMEINAQKLTIELRSFIIQINIKQSFVLHISIRESNANMGIFVPLPILMKKYQLN